MGYEQVGVSAILVVYFWEAAMLDPEMVTRGLWCGVMRCQGLMKELGSGVLVVWWIFRRVFGDLWLSFLYCIVTLFLLYYGCIQLVFI